MGQGQSQGGAVFVGNPGAGGVGGSGGTSVTNLPHGVWRLRIEWEETSENDIDLTFQTVHEATAVAHRYSAYNKCVIEFVPFADPQRW